MHEHPNSRFPAVLLASVLVLVSTAGAAAPAGNTSPNKAANCPSNLLRAKVMDFRQQAQPRPDAAFERFVDNKAQAQQLFGPLGRTLCPTMDPAKGWPCFFETSVWSLDFINFNTAAAVFYHPYSDVALVTIWTRNGAGTTMSDAELLMGDALRNRGKPPYKVDPYWLRNHLPAHLAAGIASARTLRSSGQIFSSINQSAKGGWRSAFPALANTPTMTVNRLGVGVMFERYLTGLSNYLTNARLKPVRNQTHVALKQIRTKQFAALYQTAGETKPQVRSALEKDPARWGQAKVMACVTKRDENKKEHTFVLLGIPGLPAFLMSFWFQEGATETSPLVFKRIDLVDQNATYQSLDSIKKMTAGN